MIESYDCAGLPNKADNLMKKYGSPQMINDREVSGFTRAAVKNLKTGSPDAAYTNYLNAYEIAPSNAIICRQISEICFTKLLPPRPLEAIEWNTKASKIMQLNSGKKFIEAEFNSALIQENIGRVNTAIKLYEEIVDYLNSEKRLQTNWLFKTYVYLGAAREKKGHLKETLLNFQNAENYVTTPAERNSISTHITRMKQKLQ